MASLRTPEAIPATALFNVRLELAQEPSFDPLFGYNLTQLNIRTLYPWIVRTHAQIWDYDMYVERPGSEFKPGEPKSGQLQFPTMRPTHTSGHINDPANVLRRSSTQIAEGVGDSLKLAYSLSLFEESCLRTALEDGDTLSESSAAFKFVSKLDVGSDLTNILLRCFQEMIRTEKAQEAQLLLAKKMAAGRIEITEKALKSYASRYLTRKPTKQFIDSAVWHFFSAINSARAGGGEAAVSIFRFARWARESSSLGVRIAEMKIGEYNDAIDDRNRDEPAGWHRLRTIDISESHVLNYFRSGGVKHLYEFPGIEPSAITAETGSSRTKSREIGKPVLKTALAVVPSAQEVAVLLAPDGWVAIDNTPHYLDEDEDSVTPRKGGSKARKPKDQDHANRIDDKLDDRPERREK